MPRKKARKNSSKATANYPNTSFSLPDENGGFKLLKALRSYASDNEKSSSEVVRNLLKKFLGRRGYYKL